MFTDLLISTCDIQESTLTQSGYEEVRSWEDKLTDVLCRKDSDNTAKIQNTEIRVNTDDDIFFFEADVDIVRGNRIVFDNEYYGVIKVNKLYDDEGVHHLEVKARATDNN